MPVAAQDGVLGIEARHNWIEIEAATVLATLGDLDGSPYFYRIIDIVGLHGLPDSIEDNAERKTEAVGNVEYPSRVGARNVTYTVEVVGETLQEMRHGGSVLAAAFGPDVNTGLVPTRAMIVTPHPSYGTQEHAFRARCLQCAPGGDRQERGPGHVRVYARTYTIGLRLHDPRIYEWDPEAPLGFVNPKWQ